MSCSDSPCPTGRRIAYSEVRSPLTLDHVLDLAFGMGFPALPSATAELFVINLIAQRSSSNTGSYGLAGVERIPACGKRRQIPD